MNRKNKNKNDQFISLSEDYEDEESFDDEDYVEEEDFIKKRKRRASEGDLEKIKKNKHLKNNYFNNLSKNEQKIILEKETEIYKFLNDHTPLRYNIINSNLYLSTKSMILQKIDQFEEMNQEETEYHKLGKWINSLSKIPFNNYSKMILEIKPNKVQYFLMNSYQKLDKTIYGQYKAKNKIMQVLAQWISNPDSMGQVIACEGPAGVGKTSLIKNGVSDVLNRPFSFML